jgi:HlyD family secretion protein
MDGSLSENMPRRMRTFVLLGIVLIAISTVGFYAWQHRTPYKTERARLGSLDFIVSGNGKVASNEQVDVGPKVGGLVAQLLVKEGDIVKAGQVVARLEDQELQARLRQATSAVDESQTAIEVTQVQVNQAKDHLARVQKLFDGGVAPRAELDDARHAAELRAAQLRTSYAARRQAQASLEYARTQLNNTVVTAPLAGRVIAKYRERGSVVQAGEALFTLADNVRPMVRVEVDESDAGKIRVGMPAVVTSDAFPGRKFTGNIQKIAWRVGRKRIRSDNPAELTDTKVLEAEIPLENDPSLRIGMAMDVKILAGQKDKALLIPRSAVQRRGSDVLVMVVNGARVEERPIQLGGFAGTSVEVLNGLQPGEAVVVGKE